MGPVWVSDLGEEFLDGNDEIMTLVEFIIGVLIISKAALESQQTSSILYLLLPLSLSQFAPCLTLPKSPPTKANYDPPNRSPQPNPTRTTTRATTTTTSTPALPRREPRPTRHPKAPRRPLPLPRHRSTRPPRPTPTRPRPPSPRPTSPTRPAPSSSRTRRTATHPPLQHARLALRSEKPHAPRPLPLPLRLLILLVLLPGMLLILCEVLLLGGGGCCAAGPAHEAGCEACETPRCSCACARGDS